MHGTSTGSESFSLYLIAPPAAIGLAAAVLARHLGISETRALQRLSAHPGRIAQGLEPQAAQGLMVLLSALGVPLHLRRDGDTAPLCNIWLQLSVWANPHSTARRLALLLGRDMADVLVALARPGGLVLPDLTPEEARDLQDRLTSIRGLIVLRSDGEGARYDLFATRPLNAAETARLTDGLRLIGARPDPLTGAAAAGLCPRQRNHLVSRVPDLGLVALDRGIQRFDLHLIGVTGWVTKDLADFLAARTGQPRARFEVISPTQPVLLDHGLTHAVLRQFCADYAAIGLMTRPLLRGLTRFPDNPIL